MSHPVRSVTVFCGSRHGQDPVHRAAAEALGAGLARAGLHVVYGGGSVGLMGVVAESALAAGGRVTGVIPEFLTRIERIFPAAAELEVTTSMHTRKTRMFELSDACIALSGGLGTMDELVEIITWKQLGLHNKPVLVLNIAGWARPFLALVDSLIEQGFASAENRDLFEVMDSVEAAIARFTALNTPDGAAPASRL